MLPPSYSISPKDLWNVIATKDSPQIIDVRLRDDYSRSSQLLPGAVSRDPARTQLWMNEFDQSRSIVVACKAGHEMSQGVVAQLRAHGFDAHVLDGGYEAWAKARLPFVAKGELERIAGMGFQAVEIGTNVMGRYLDDPDVVEVLEAAADLNLAVFVHPWDAIGEDRMRSYYLPHMVALPADTTLAIARLIFGGILGAVTGGSVVGAILSMIVMAAVVYLPIIMISFSMPVGVYRAIAPRASGDVFA